MARARALAPVVLVAVLVGGLAACGGDGDEVAAPTPLATLDGESPVVAIGQAGVKPFVEPTCPTPRRVRTDSDVTKAAAEIAQIGEKRYRKVYAGVVPCVPAGRVVVYKLPEGGSALMRAVERIGRDRNVEVTFAEALFSYRDAQATRKSVLSQFARLDEAGAPFAVLRIRENGTVEVAVRDNVAGAEAVLTDLLDRIYVVHIPEDPAVASPAPQG
ncbi:hypothetical protein [Sporichthya polymorpha]|uniref:hypothetical protein n=1 Tax=Sporichthya polymorpha TaxID=35751 RepID=UPI0003692CFD|nr:hypothetical protein [Sporichthya polymorpha]